MQLERDEAHLEHANTVLKCNEAKKWQKHLCGSTMVVYDGGRLRSKCDKVQVQGRSWRVEAQGVKNTAQNLNLLLVEQSCLHF